MAWHFFWQHDWLYDPRTKHVNDYKPEVSYARRICQTCGADANWDYYNSEWSYQGTLTPTALARELTAMATT